MPKDRPHIAFYLYNLSGGGAERITVNLMHNFIQLGLKIDLVINTKTNSPYLPMVPPEVRVLELKLGSRKGIPKLITYLRQEQPLVLLSSLHYNNEIAILAKYLAVVPTKVMVCEHNTLSLRAKRQNSGLKWAILLTRMLYPLSNGILAVSHSVAQDLAQVSGIPLKRINTIYNPVISSGLLEQSKEPLDHPWFAPSEPPVILGVGRLNEQKDFSTLIRAFALVRQEKPARLMILGQGAEEKKLKALAKELDIEKDVAFPGFQSNPYPFIAKAAVFALSSLWEGLPTVLIEAMALGTPVVATDCPGGSAEIVNNGKYGSLVPMGDSQALAEEILSILSGNFKLVDSAWLEQFTLKTASQKYLDFLGICMN
ncbi:MAG: glycosyltransferase [Cyanobacteria bacterium J083]|nr:MAG: glycosyltransferase [Cyanobacteria bacterium J083]